MGSSSPNRELVFDEVRKCWVKATPEERVRQKWLRRMVYQLEYPKELLVVEKELKELPHLKGMDVPNRRLDILCYGKGIEFPLLLIECKDERLSARALDQVIGYNHHVRACFVAAVGHEEAQLGYFNADEKKYVFYSVLPSFKELMLWVKR